MEAQVLVVVRVMYYSVAGIPDYMKGKQTTQLNKQKATNKTKQEKRYLLFREL